MNARIVLVSSLLWLFLAVSIVQAQEKVNPDRLSQLESTIETLKMQVQDLQKEQALKENCQPEAAWLKNVNIGGNLKVYLFDQSIGKANDVSTRNHISAGLSTFYLFVGKKFSDWFTVTIKPRIQVVASATPKLGDTAITRAKAAYETNLYEAFMWVRLPAEIEVRAGKLSLLFHEDYAKEMWWFEQYHLNPGIHYIYAWYDNGVEVYHNFNFNEWSLPAYFYLVNGDGGEVDDNNAKTFMVHAAPEFFHGGLRILGSYGRGKWKEDDYMVRYLSALEVRRGGTAFKGGYIYRKDDNRPWTKGINVDAETRVGYYAKLLHQFAPQWRAVADYSIARMKYKGVGYQDRDATISLALDYFVTDESAIVAQAARNFAKRSDNTAKLTYSRFTLGWRTTF